MLELYDSGVRPPDQPTVICCWCGKTLVQGSQMVSDGLCGPCLPVFVAHARAILKRSADNAGNGCRARAALRPAEGAAAVGSVAPGTAYKRRRQ